MQRKRNGWVAKRPFRGITKSLTVQEVEVFVDGGKSLKGGRWKKEGALSTCFGAVCSSELGQMNRKKRNLRLSSFT
jgi:hypothetical protein